MTKSTATKLILCEAYGDYYTYLATTENAMNIFHAHIDNLMPEIVEISKNTKFRYIEAEMVAAICDQVFSTPVGENLSLSNTVNTKEIVAELSVLMIENNLNKDSFKKSYTLTSDMFEKLKTFSLLKKFIESEKKPVQFLPYSDYLETANTYKRIMKNNWKQGVEEYKIAEHIINFVNKNLVHRDVKFEVIDLQEKYS